MTLQLTQNCNFRCAYCHYTCNDGSQRTHSSKRMSVEVAKAAILYLRDHSVDTQSVYIGFYGGEPFLEFSLLKEVVAFCEDQLRGKDIHFTVTSNGTLLTEYSISALVSPVGLGLFGRTPFYAANRTHFIMQLMLFTVQLLWERRYFVVSR